MESWHMSQKTYFIHLKKTYLSTEDENSNDWPKVFNALYLSHLIGQL